MVTWQFGRFPNLLFNWNVFGGHFSTWNVQNLIILSKNSLNWNNLKLKAFQIGNNFRLKYSKLFRFNCIISNFKSTISLFIISSNEESANISNSMPPQFENFNLNSLSLFYNLRRIKITIKNIYNIIRGWGKFRCFSDRWQYWNINENFVKKTV